MIKQRPVENQSAESEQEKRLCAARRAVIELGTRIAMGLAMASSAS